MSATAISPLDGRYQDKCAELKDKTTEYGLMYYRLLIEIRWLQALSALPQLSEVTPLSEAANDFLNKLISNFNETDANQIKQIEKITNHDVKAVEYFLKDKLSEQAELTNIKEFIHFACTSEDINNLAYGLMLKDCQQQILFPHIESLVGALQTIATEQASTPMLARTHGQAASPTTVGKEIANVIARIKRQQQQFLNVAILGKINGAVGNFNAHVVAFPDINWQNVAQKFVTDLGLGFNPLTTQIEPHDAMAEYFHCLMRLNTILIDFSRDVWGYISLGYFRQKVVANEVGSSTMPHKVNPIDFENAEGNFGLANALLGFFAEKLPISRWQRDLTDSTVQRNIGVAIGYMLIALKSLQKGIAKLEVNTLQLAKDLDENWEVLGEALQTVMRRYGIPEPYEKLKALTRGKKITQPLLAEFIDSLALPETVKLELKKLTPKNYVGLAAELASKWGQA